MDGELSPNYVFRNAQANPACPPEILKTLIQQSITADEPYPNEVAMAAQSNPSCPQDMLSKIIDDWDGTYTDSTSLLLRVQRNPSCPPDRLERIFNGWTEKSFGDVYDRAQCNPSLPVHILRMLLDSVNLDNKNRVRVSAQTNNALPLDIITEILSRWDGRTPSPIIHAILTNPRCPAQRRLNYTMNTSRGAGGIKSNINKHTKTANNAALNQPVSIPTFTDWISLKRDT